MDFFKNLLINKKIDSISKIIKNEKFLNEKDENNNTPFHLIIQQSQNEYNNGNIEYSQKLQNLIDNHPNKNTFLNLMNSNNEQIILNPDYMSENSISDRHSNSINFSDSVSDNNQQFESYESTDFDLESNSLQSINVNSLTFSEEEELYYTDDKNLKGGGKDEVAEEKTAEKVVEEAAEKVAEKAAEKVAEKVAEKAAEEAAEEAAEKAAEKAEENSAEKEEKIEN